MAQNFPPFYVGQRVVRVGASVHPFVKKGDVYTVAAIKQCQSCKNWKVSCVEFHPTHSGHGEYCNCGNIIISDGFIYGRAEGFAPIQENFQSISLEKILEEETKLVSAN